MVNHGGSGNLSNNVPNDHELETHRNPQINNVIQGLIKYGTLVRPNRKRNDAWKRRPILGHIDDPHKPAHDIRNPSNSTFANDFNANHRCILGDTISCSCNNSRAKSPMPIQIVIARLVRIIGPPFRSS